MLIEKDFNRIIKVVFIFGAFATFLLSFHNGVQLAPKYGNHVKYIFPILGLVYAMGLFSILKYKHIVAVVLTFVWIYGKTIIEILLTTDNFSSAQFGYSLVNNTMLVIVISLFLLIRKDGISGWRLILDNSK